MPIRSPSRSIFKPKDGIDPKILERYEPLVKQIDRRKLSQLGSADVLRVVDACHAAGLSDWATHGVLTALRRRLSSLCAATCLRSGAS